MPSANAANRLIDHYLWNARDLPWRVPPGGAAPDPYCVWLSEVMLQQTTVAAVAPRFERFVSRWPTIEALAAARDEEVLSEWAGLGYYARARNLIACARVVAAHGGFPRNSVGLRKLPGLGDYTAAAIAAIAFGEAVPVVDTNVRRVAARLFALEQPSLGEIRDRLAPMVPSSASGDFAQAMMDLGATICRPLQPRCGACPLAEDCAAFRLGQQERFPAARPKKAKPRRFGIAYWTERDGHVWLVRRPAKGLLGGMTALPGTDWALDPIEADAAMTTVRHVFTHFALDLAVVTASDRHGEGWWQPIASLDEAGLPTLYRKAVAQLLAQRTTRQAA